MSRKQKSITKLILLTTCLFSLVSCGNNEKILDIVFDENYQEVWKVGEIDFSKLFFEITYENGNTEKIPVNISMINEKDLYKFYEVGDWKVKIIYNEKYSAIVDFTIVENEFSDDLKLKSEIIAYDGMSHGLSLEGPLPEGTKVYFPFGNNFTLYSQNPYQVKCIVSKEGYKTKELNGTLTITKSDYDKALLDAIEFVDAEFVYDGFEKKITANNIPQDCSIEYYIDKKQGNGRIDVGVYQVTGVLTCSNPNYKEIPNITATLTIKKAPYDMSEVEFKNKIFTYEKGKKHTLVIENKNALPGGVKVSYANNEHEDAGEYEAVAYFEGDSNHEPIAPMKAKLTITKKDISLADIKVIGEQTTYYNGEKQDFKVDNVPDGIKVIRRYFDKKGVELTEAPTNVGVYTVKISFGLDDGLKEGNFNLLNIPKVDGILYIQKKVINLNEYNFDSQSFVYDGLVHDFDIETKIVDGKKVTTKLPEEINVEKTYIFNGEELVLSKPKEVGTYIVNFKVTLKEGLLNDNFDIRNIPTESGRLIITKRVIDLIDINPTDQTVVFNEEPQQYVLEGVPTDSIITKIVYHDAKGVEITPDKVKNVGDYRIHIFFNLNEEGGFDSSHYELANAKVRQPYLHIVKQRVDFTDVVPTDVVAKANPSGFVYQGTYIKNFVLVSKYVDIVESYSKREGSTFVPIPPGDYPREAGKYQAKISFKLKQGKDPNNYDLYRMNEYVVNITLE